MFFSYSEDFAYKVEDGTDHLKQSRTGITVVLVFQLKIYCNTGSFLLLG